MGGGRSGWATSWLIGIGSDEDGRGPMSGRGREELRVRGPSLFCI